MNRRAFIRTSTLAASAAALLPCPPLAAAETAPAVAWPIGCLNRPWISGKQPYTYDVALDGIKAAGYKLTGLHSRTPKEPLTGSDATPEYLAELKKRIAARGLAVNMAAMRLKGEQPVAVQIRDLRKQIDNAKFMGAEFLLTFGAEKPAFYEAYYQVMRDGAPYAQERGLKLVLKPHGGASGAADEISRCLDKVGHPNFKIWFDAGNIVFYTGKDPVEQVKPIAQHVTGFCAKDMDKQKGTPWLDFGKGTVDFAGVFTVLKKAGFHGPVMVECCALGATPEELSANARKNREYLEKVFAAL
jgi:sugar phosphate isomerase/epimerase